MSDVWDDVVAMSDDPANPVDDVDVNLTVMLGETTMPIHELLRLGRGAVIALDTTEDDDVNIQVGELKVAVGQLKLNGERIEISVTETKIRGSAYRAPSVSFKQTGMDLELEEDFGEELDPPSEAQAEDVLELDD